MKKIILAEHLKESYKKIFETSKPDWAVHKKSEKNELLIPTIPFVGKNYYKQKTKILIYASAENLADYVRKESNHDGLLDDNEKAIDRHRESLENHDNNYFPDVHIQPMNDGTLALAALFFAYKNGFDVSDLSPKDFYEEIAFGNYCKYTIESEKNIDLTSLRKKEAIEKLEFSRKYIEKDIEILKPNIIILPKSLYKINKNIIDNSIENTSTKKYLIWQMTPRVIHGKQISKYKDHDIPSLPNTFNIWNKKINSRINNERMLIVMKYLDEVYQNE